MGRWDRCSVVELELWVVFLSSHISDLRDDRWSRRYWWCLWLLARYTGLLWYT